MRRIFAGLVLGVLAAATVPAFSASAQAETTTADPAPVPQTIELRCRKAIIQVEIDGALSDRLVIGCRWTQASSTHFGGYKLIRKVDDRPRHMIFGTRDIEHTHFLDRNVAEGHIYRYRLAVVSPSGTVIAVSNLVRVAT
jgi:hypothetical protein